ncbi:MAG: hypothetical protein JSW11_05175 [Candidatus Heimdallarchaeota archaeon]|nr:MAG: hypothetical protein JSW11_05175 [Candidatus Heimdallarchaeota archaeon]
MISDTLIFLGASGVLLSVEALNIKRHYTSVNSKVIENQYSFLLPISIINITLIALSLLLGLYADFFYSIAILIGMSIGLIGDLNNRSIHSSIKGFVLGSSIFIVSYLCFSIGLLYTSGGFHFPLDLVVIGFACLSYCFLVMSSWDSDFFQHLGKFRLITNFYPILLLFLLSRAIINLFQSSLPFQSVFLLTIAILLIFITDMEFSIDKFFKSRESLVGPVLYPVGQLTLALSTLLIAL